jgi:hypothetical protein
MQAHLATEKSGNFLTALPLWRLFPNPKQPLEYLKGNQQNGVECNLGFPSKPFFSRIDSSTVQQDCQMVWFQTKNPNLGMVLHWKMLVYFMDTWAHFTVFCYIL